MRVSANGTTRRQVLEGVDFARLRADDREEGRLFRPMLISVEVCMGCRWLGMSGEQRGEAFGGLGEVGAAGLGRWSEWW
jgi:hypothetical protein